MKPEIIAGRPDEFSDEERTEFIDLVLLGGEVSEGPLRTNVPDARRLVFLRDGKRLIGVVALKVPQATYRAKFLNRTGVAVAEDDYPYELGYAFVIESARKDGHGNSLVDACLDAQKQNGIFATAREDNEAMHRLLGRYGFAKAGDTYKGGNSGEDMRLFLRAATPEA